MGDVKLPLPLPDASTKGLGSGTAPLTDGSSPGAAMVERLCVRIDKLRQDAQEALTPSRSATPVLTPRGGPDEGSVSECGSASLRGGPLSTIGSTSWPRGGVSDNVSGLYSNFAPASNEVSPGAVTRETLTSTEARDAPEPHFGAATSREQTSPSEPVASMSIVNADGEELAALIRKVKEGESECADLEKQLKGRLHGVSELLDKVSAEVLAEPGGPFSKIDLLSSR